MADEKIRLQKYMAECGIASRRKSEDLIVAGKVTVNGKVANLGDKINPKKDKVSVDGRKLQVETELKYIMLNKPRGYITTMSDEMDRKCVAELVSDVGVRVYPVGRLDKDSEGLLLLTNDGEFANKMTHPKNQVPKTYRVTIYPSITEEQINELMTGIMIDGKKTLPADVHVVTQEKNRVVLEIVICEGRNRQIRKMCEGVGLKVARLRRVAIGPVKLGMLKQGTHRDLTSQEIKSLKNY
ncbi:MAG: rRNA pseudouridine synthase [Ruminococcaceae bacterium]|nr:rRNA pseudouridine synthase [Oscillospiraceae bacterium]